MGIDMIAAPIANPYQDCFFRLAASGGEIIDAITTLIHRYLDGKPVRVGTRNLNSADRDLEFWSAEVWDKANAAIYETEAYALAFAGYLWQPKIVQV